MKQLGFKNDIDGVRLGLRAADMRQMRFKVSKNVLEADVYKGLIEGLSTKGIRIRNDIEGIRKSLGRIIKS